MGLAFRLLLSVVMMVGCAPPQGDVQRQRATEGSAVMDDKGGERPAWDEMMAQDLVGARVLVGITYLRADGTLESQTQIYGTITSAHPVNGIMISLEGHRVGETYQLPPDLRGIEVAPPGSYRLRSTGETVEDPDYTATWTITRPQN